MAQVIDDRANVLRAEFTGEVISPADPGYRPATTMHAYPSPPFWRIWRGPTSRRATGRASRRPPAWSFSRIGKTPPALGFLFRQAGETAEL